jgi:hypothetical protein
MEHDHLDPQADLIPDFRTLALVTRGRPLVYTETDLSYTTRLFVRHAASYDHSRNRFYVCRQTDLYLALLFPGDLCAFFTSRPTNR